MECVEIPVKQGSPEWLRIRRGMITPSKFGAVCGSSITEKNNYLRQLRNPPPPFETEATNWGKKYEPEALDNYNFWLITESSSDERLRGDCGFFVPVFSKWSSIGGSPDAVLEGITGIVGGCEIKCPFNESVHASYCMNGCPPNYFWQIQGYMWLLNAGFWDFVSYDPRNTVEPFYRQRLYRDSFIMARVERAVKTFRDKFLSGEEFDVTPSANSVLLSSNFQTYLKK